MQLGGNFLEVDGSLHCSWKWELPLPPSTEESAITRGGSLHKLPYTPIDLHLLPPFFRTPLSFHESPPSSSVSTRSHRLP